MAKQVYFNNKSFHIPTSLSDSDTEILVTNAQGVTLGPDEFIVGTLIPAGGSGDLEIIHITGVVGNKFTVVRGQEGTFPQNYLYGSLLEFRVTAGSLNALVAPDVTLRADLADPSQGANLVGYRPGVTVRQALDDLENDLNETNQAVDILENQNARIFGSGLDAATIDMHFGILRGRGWTAGDPPWNAGDPQNIHSTTATAAASTSTTDIPVASATDFNNGMLICYLGIDNRYYIAKLHEILPGPVFRLGRNLPQAIALGAPVYNFYRDEAHPNTYGGAAIVDLALAKLGGNYRIRHLESKISDGMSWSPYNGGTLSTYAALSYSNPGETGVYRRGVTLTTNAAGSGAQSTLISLNGGDYVVSLQVNMGLRTGGFSGQLNLSVLDRTLSGESFTIATTSEFGYDDLQTIEIPFSVGAGSSIQIIATTDNSGEQVSRLGPISIYKLGDRLTSINRGKHVLFGDSWFSVGSAMATRFINRLTQADVVVKGVSGNKASDMIARFDADVRTENPDYVWVMVGTNDYYAGVTPALFEQQLMQIRRMIQSIGALPIIFNASVGSIEYSPPQLNPSRQYALRVRNDDPAHPVNGASSTVRNATFFTRSIEVPGNSEIIMGVSPGMTTGDAFLRAAYVSQTDLTVDIGYSTSVQGSGAVDLTEVKPTGTSGATNKIAPRITDRDPRFVVIILKNGTSGALTTTFTADVCWNERN